MWRSFNDLKMASHVSGTIDEMHGWETRNIYESDLNVSPVAKYLMVIINLSRADIASRRTVSFRAIIGATKPRSNSKLSFDKRRKFVNRAGIWRSNSFTKFSVQPFSFLFCSHSRTHTSRLFFNFNSFFFFKYKCDNTRTNKALLSIFHISILHPLQPAKIIKWQINKTYKYGSVIALSYIWQQIWLAIYAYGKHVH